MRIAFLCKRRYTGMDVIGDRFGRLYALPAELAQLGHNLRSWCLDYHVQGRPEHHAHDAFPGSLKWKTRSLAGLRLALSPVYPFQLLRELRSFSPDLIIGASDIPHIAMAAWAAGHLGIPYIVDLYDNFESFQQARIPGFRSLLKSAVRGASLVVAVSEPLRDKIYQDYAPKCRVQVIPNGVDLRVFAPGNRAKARQRLGLPERAKLIGTAGGLSRMKGVDTIYESWRRISATRPDVHLVLAGPIESRIFPPQGKRVHYLGTIPQSHVADLFRALDVGIITVADTPFGRYCFPQKAQEMLACSLPIVCSDVGALKKLLTDMPKLLFGSRRPDELAEAIFCQLDSPVVPNTPVYSWAQLAASLEPQLPRSC